MFFKPLQVAQDLTLPGGCENLVNRTLTAFGRIDILVNSAGIFSNALITDENYFDVFNAVTAINEIATIRMIKLSAPSLSKTTGSVISIASIAATITPVLFT